MPIINNLPCGGGSFQVPADCLPIVVHYVGSASNGKLGFRYIQTTSEIYIAPASDITTLTTENTGCFEFIPLVSFQAKWLLGTSGASDYYTFVKGNLYRITLYYSSSSYRFGIYDRTDSSNIVTIASFNSTTNKWANKLLANITY